MGKRLSGLSGSITVHRSCRSLKIAYIPQYDKVMRALTCREAIVFASKLQNVRRTHATDTTDNESGDCKDTDFHDKLAVSIMSRLGLMVCADTRIAQCSGRNAAVFDKPLTASQPGGQQKRISIAMELVSKPDVLICDEPTSG